MCRSLDDLFASTGSFLRNRARVATSEEDLWAGRFIDTLQALIIPTVGSRTIIYNRSKGHSCLVEGNKIRFSVSLRAARQNDIKSKCFGALVCSQTSYIHIT